MKVRTPPNGGKKKKRVRSGAMLTTDVLFYGCILSIDQSLESCGYAVYDGVNFLTYGTETYIGCIGRRAKYRRFVTVMRALIEQYSPDAIVIEDVRLFHGGGVNLDAITALAGFHALIMVISNIPVYSLDTNVWKQALFNAPTAHKAISLSYVQTELQIEIYDDNIADAMCIAVATAREGTELVKIA